MNALADASFTPHGLTLTPMHCSRIFGHTDIGEKGRFSFGHYLYGISLATCLRFVASITVDFLSFRFLFVVFFVRIWLENALFLTIFPDPVVLKRFAAPRFVLIFGILYLHSQKDAITADATLSREGERIPAQT